MLQKIVINILLITTFFFGGTFWCSAFILHHNAVWEKQSIQEPPMDDCCPKDGQHKTHIEWKWILSAYHNNDNEPTDKSVSQNNSIRNYASYQTTYTWLGTTNHKDKQSFFFTETVRLLL